MNRREEDADSPASTPVVSTLSLSLVVPAYNEGSRLAAGFSRLREAVASGAIDPRTTEFVVVDDGSTDDTSEQAAALFAPFPHVQLVRLAKNQGKGAAVRAGVAVATAPSIAFADADMAIDPAQTPEFATRPGRGRPGHRLACRLRRIRRPRQPPAVDDEPHLQHAGQRLDQRVAR